MYTLVYYHRKSKKFPIDPSIEIKDLANLNDLLNVYYDTSTAQFKFIKETEGSSEEQLVQIVILAINTSARK
jgi:hypothetical protein